MNILIIGKNSRLGYSGGRFYAWLLANALGEAGHQVVYRTNCRPVFANDEFGSKVELVEGSLLRSRLPRRRFDIVIVIPHPHIERFVDNDWLYFRRAVMRARRDSAMLVLLNFETPNWVEHVLGVSRNPDTYRYWREYAKRAHLVLSISSEGSKFAEEYYGPLNPNAKFAYCHPPVNSRACDAVAPQAADGRVIVITRLSDAHKNPRGIVELIGEGLRGRTLELIAGAGGAQGAIRAEIEERAKECGVRVLWKERVTDEEKFGDLKRSQLLVYPSLFEGYGLPPIEAQYCGARVLAFDLPVLREVSRWPEGIQFVTPGDYAALRQRCAEMVAESYDRNVVRANILDIATFSSFVERIGGLVAREYAQYSERKESFTDSGS